MSFALLSASVALAAWTSVKPEVDVAGALAACRDEATLVGARGRTRDWRLFDACMAARGVHRAERTWGWLPVAGASCVRAEPVRSASAEDWEGCLEGAQYEDASGWPRIDAGEVSTCMARAGWREADASAWRVATTSCTSAAVAAR